MDANDAYAILAERLEFPGSTHLQRVLEYLMTPGQAQIATELPGSIDQVAEKMGIPREKVKEQLDQIDSRIQNLEGELENKEET